MNVIIKRQKGMKMTTLAEGQSRDDALSLSEVKSFGQTAETPHNSAELWGGGHYLRKSCHLYCEMSLMTSAKYLKFLHLSAKFMCSAVRLPSPHKSFRL